MRQVTHPLLAVTMVALVTISGIAGLGAAIEPATQSDTVPTRIAAGDDVRSATGVSFSDRLHPPAGTADSTGITGCTDISSPGRYTVGQDIIDTNATTCINVTASDVVLDGLGHRIDGQNTADTVGIAVYGASNVTVRNLSVTDWNAGVYLYNASASTVTEVSANSNDAGYGVLLVNSTTSRITNNTANGNRWNGIYLFASSETLIADNTVRRNGFAGIGVEPGRDNQIVDNIAANNGVMGIGLAQTTGHLVRDNRLHANNASGIALYDADGAYLTNNTVRANRWWGFHIQAGSTENVVRNTTVAGSFAAFRFTAGSSDNDLRHVVATNNTWSYIAVNESTNRAENFSTDSAKVSFNARDVALKPVASPPPTPDNQTGVGPYLNVTSTRTGSWLNLTIHYGTDAPSSIDESTLSLWRFNGTAWSEISGSVVNPSRNTVSANVSEFSVMAPLASETASVPPIGDFERPPTDPDDDGKFEDVNGDGSLTVVDVQAFFTNYDSDVVQNHVPAFDFNDDGSVNIIDVQALFLEAVA